MMTDGELEWVQEPVGQAWKQGVPPALEHVVNLVEQEIYSRLDLGARVVKVGGGSPELRDPF